MYNKYYLCFKLGIVFIIACECLQKVFNFKMYNNVHYRFFLAIVSSQAQQQQNNNSTIPSISSNTRFNDELVGHVVAAGGVTTLTSTGSMGISGTPGMSPPLPLVEPKFNYVTFNTTNSSQIMSMIVINSQVNYFLSNVDYLYTNFVFINILF